LYLGCGTPQRRDQTVTNRKEVRKNVEIEQAHREIQIRLTSLYAAVKRVTKKSAAKFSGTGMTIDIAQAFVLN
jgi:hypothetical protein